MPDLHAVPFAFPDVAGRRILFLGLGGGCDAITAFALAELFGRGAGSAVYANTKTADVGAVEPLTPHIVRVTGPQLDTGRVVPRRGRCWIDHSVPRQANGSPWIILLRDSDAESSLVGELRAQNFDLLVGVDTGGDSVARKGGRGHRGRDQRMLAVLRCVGAPLLHVVVAPGCDGEALYDDLRGAMAELVDAGKYRGCFALGPLLPIFEPFRGSLGPTRTPRIILDAAEGRLPVLPNGRVQVPRGREPTVPKLWLATAFVFAPDVAAKGAT
jgi:hypothetical protein